jgi:hypothetical protein
MSEPYADRAMSCVIACEGIPTAELDRVAFLWHNAQKYAEVVMNPPKPTAEEAAFDRLVDAAPCAFDLLQEHADNSECDCDPNPEKGLDPCYHCRVIALLNSINGV